MLDWEVNHVIDAPLGKQPDAHMASGSEIETSQYWYGLSSCDQFLELGVRCLWSTRKCFDKNCCRRRCLASGFDEARPLQDLDVIPATQKGERAESAGAKKDMDGHWAVTCWSSSTSFSRGACAGVICDSVNVRPYTRPLPALSGARGLSPFASRAS